jgi:hypothetical protein
MSSEAGILPSGAASTLNIMSGIEIIAAKVFFKFKAISP